MKRLTADALNDFMNLMPASLPEIEEAFTRKFGRAPILGKDQTFEEYEAALKASLEAGEIRGVRLLGMDRSVVLD